MIKKLRMTEVDKQIMQTFEEVISPSTIQLFELKDDFKSLSSGVLFKASGKHWLLTASHVSKCSQEGNEIYFQYNKDEFISITGHFGESDLKRDNQIDFSCIALIDECVDKILLSKVFLSVDKISYVQRQFEKQSMIVAGFPEVLNKVDPKESIKSVGKFILTSTTNRKPYDYYGFEPGDHVFVEAGGVRTNMKSGKKGKPFDPHGFSGGGLWQVWKEEDSFKCALVGILTEFRNSKYHIYISIRIEHLIRLIENYKQF